MEMSANILPTSEVSNKNSPSGEWPTTKEMSSITNIDGIHEQDNEKSKCQEFWGVLEHTSIDVEPNTSSPKSYSPSKRLNPYYCEVCKAEMTGPEPYRQHMTGGSHARQVKRLNLENSFTEVDVTKREENVPQNNSIIQPTMSPSLLNYHCSTCNKSMSGIEPYQQHMRGIQHQRKQRSLQLEKEMLSSSSAVIPMQQESITLSNETPIQFNASPVLPVQSNVSIQPMVVPQYYCSVCNITMSGIEPYRQHMTGGPHLKRVKNKELLELHSQTQQQVVINSEYHCKLCNKSMSGYEPYLSHMSGIQHAKEVNRQKLMQTPISHPQSVLRSEAVASTTMPEIPFECRRGLKCEVCAKRFSGIESLQDHFRSAKHKKKVEQTKEMDTSVRPSNPLPEDYERALAERMRSGLQISEEEALPVQVEVGTSTDEVLRTCLANQDVQSSFRSFT